MTRRHARGRLAAWLWLAPLVAIFVLAGCGAGKTGGASPTAPPTAATIMRHAENVPINDATFTMTFTGAWSDQAISGAATGKLTRNPLRYDITITYTSGGFSYDTRGTPTSGAQQFVFETIGDGATNTTYTKFTQPAMLATGEWTRTTGDASGSLFDPSQFTNFGQFKNPMLAGTDTINGVAVWHIKGQVAVASGTGDGNLFIRQDNYEPVRIEGLMPGSSGNFSTVLTFTAVNSGTVSITLPPADQVQSS